LGVSPNGHDIAYLLAGEKTAEDCIVKAGSRPNLYVLPASDLLADVKIELIGREVTSGLTRRKRNGAGINNILIDKLSVAAGAFDYIIIDCPPSLDMLADAVFHFADAAIVPVKPDFLGTTGTAHHTQNILDAQADGIDIHVALYLPTFYRAREVLANQMLQSLIRVYGRSRVAEPIPQAAVLEQAPAASGQTIFEYAPDSPAAAAYAKLVERVVKL
jgi:chromosome partitioning protein